MPDRHPPPGDSSTFTYSSRARTSPDEKPESACETLVLSGGVRWTLHSISVEAMIVLNRDERIERSVATRALSFENNFTFGWYGVGIQMWPFVADVFVVLAECT